MRCSYVTEQKPYAFVIYLKPKIGCVDFNELKKDKMYILQ